jgi:hypothetical protein
MQAALESPFFGFEPCMHMAHILPHPEREQLVVDAMLEVNAEKRQKILHKIFDGFAATADFPGIMFIGDLMDMYPDAKIVLNQRKNGAVWAKSITESLAFFGTWPYLAMTLLWKTDRLHYRLHRVAAQVSKRTFGGPWGFTPEFYDMYNAWVRDEAAKRGRPVLEFTPDMGLTPLAEFLGKGDPPATAKFPHLNDAATIAVLRRILVTRGIVSWIALGGVLWAGWRFGPGLILTALGKLQGFALMGMKWPTPPL